VQLGIRVCWSLISTQEVRKSLGDEIWIGPPILTPVATLACVFFWQAQSFSNPFQLQNAPVNPTHTYPPRLSLMFEQHISDDILFHHDEKLMSHNLYLCQPHTVIQLIEVASPPPHRIIHSTSSYTSSSSSSSSSFEENQEEEEEEEESIHSSYCSSDDEIDVRLSPRAASHPDTLSGRMKRILLWREQSPLLISGLSIRF
jgi:hypothetical protein